MKRKITEMGTLLLAMMLLCSCTAAVPAPTPTASGTPEPTPTPTPTPLEVNFSTIQERTAAIGQLLAAGNWATLETYLSSSCGDLPELRKNWAAVNFEKAYAVYDEDRIAGYVDFSNQVRVAIRYDDELQITRIVMENRTAAPTCQESDDYQEYPVMVGREPQLYGVLTTPKDNDSAPVAVLLAEGFSDGADASGSDATFRRDLARALAAEGVATIRYEMRLAADPSLVLDTGELSLSRMVTEDLAAAVHMLDQGQPVDPSDITLLGIHQSAAWAAALVYYHFEIKGGLVLMELSDATGADYLARQQGLTDTQKSGLSDSLKSQASTTPDTLYGLPYAYWVEWKKMDQDTYISSVSAPILLTYGSGSEDDGLYAYWKSKFGSRRRLSMRQYDELSGYLRQPDGTLDADAVHDLAVWIRTGTLPARKG